MEVKAHIKKLRSILNQHNIDYYVNDNPTISDIEYDKLLRELEALEVANPQFLTIDSPTQRVGGQPLDEFKSITHRIPLQSLANAMNNSELEHFDSQIMKSLNTADVEYIGEPKLDGLAVELVYEKGKFVYGSTRGDGYVGEDITHNLKTIKAIPLSIIKDPIPDIIEIRGEVFINKSDFKLLNKHRIKNGEAIFANARNCAAGSLRQLNPKVTMNRPLRIYCYAPGVIKGDIQFKSQIDFLKYIPQWGFPVNPHIKIGYGFSFIQDYYNKIELLRDTLDYDIDGVVFKVNAYESQDILGVRSKSPRWAIAGKLKAQQSTTVINDIILSVGRTGSITPVAQLEPTNIGGVTVSNATLHNQDELDRKDIRIGDTVLIQRAGDVIPEVIKVILDKRCQDSLKFQIPPTCPVCNGDVIRLEGEAIHRCINNLCSAKIKGAIEHYVSKRCMNIDGLGTKIVELLIEQKLVKDIGDLYLLKLDQLICLERMGEKSANNIINSINYSKKSTLSRFIHGLGIKNIGENAAKILEQYFQGDIHLIMRASKEQLISIHEIGDIMADAIIDYFSNSNNKAVISKCLKNGLIFSPIKKIKSSSISDKVFVFTGNLQDMKRIDAMNIIQSYGAKVSSSISSKTDYLILGNKAGSKLKKAEDNQVTILTEEQFYRLIKSLKNN